MLPAPKGYRYEHQFQHIKAPGAKGRRRGARDVETHDDIEALLNVVGSKNARDITRKNHFMSKAAFDEWNAKQPEGKYWGDYRDVDDDGTDEFVVRGKNEDGPLVAINGYTTKSPTGLLDVITMRLIQRLEPVQQVVLARSQKNYTVKNTTTTAIRPTLISSV